MTKVHTRTFSALNPRAALPKRVHAESSCKNADGAKLREGQRVTIDPRIIWGKWRQKLIAQTLTGTYRAGEHVRPKEPHSFHWFLELRMQISHQRY